MRTELSRKDPDFDAWAVKQNGSYMRHDIIVAASTVDNTVTHFVLGAAGDVTDETKVRNGRVRIIPRNASVIDKEPVSRAVQAPLPTPSEPAVVDPESAPEIFEESAEEVQKPVPETEAKPFAKKNGKK